MASGFYPSPPAKRFAYHLDGTMVFLEDSTSALTQLTAAQLVNLNDEASTSGLNGIPYVKLLFLFPEQRNFQNYFISTYFWTGSAALGSLEVSSDTTTGLDGTWISVANPWAQVSGSNIIPDFRSSINSVSAGLVTGVRFNYTPSGNGSTFYTVHLYGDIPTTSNPDRLMFWEATNDTEALDAYFDWGDVQQGSTQAVQFRLYNNSSTKMANSISISSGNTTGDMAAQFSTDGVTYTSTITLASLAPATASSVLYMQLAVPGSETLTVQAAYLRATAGSWS